MFVFIYNVTSTLPNSYHAYFSHSLLLHPNCLGHDLKEKFEHASQQAPSPVTISASESTPPHVSENLSTKM